MATWEHTRSVEPVRWRGSLTTVLGGDPDTFTVPGVEPCPNLAQWLLAPVLTVVEGGGPWDDYELERTVLDPGGQRARAPRPRPADR